MDGRVHVYSVERGEAGMLRGWLQVDVAAHARSVSAIDMHPAASLQQQFASVGEDGVLNVWTLLRPESAPTLGGTTTTPRDNAQHGAAPLPPSDAGGLPKGDPRVDLHLCARMPDMMLTGVAYVSRSAGAGKLAPYLCVTAYDSRELRMYAGF